MAALAGMGARSMHIAIDMQRVFAEPGRWQVTGIPAIVPHIRALAKAMPGRTLFTRFIVPERPRDAPGQWQRYYEHWSEFTGAALGPGKLDLVDGLAVLADPAAIIDKPTYSAFEAPVFAARLKALQADALIFSGVETDVCVLATLLTAVDRGFRVVAVDDAMASSSQPGHDATLRHVLTRFPLQVEIASTSAVIAALG
jgi:nicotinamidase-related amidase